MLKYFPKRKFFLCLVTFALSLIVMKVATDVCLPYGTENKLISSWSVATEPECSPLKSWDVWARDRWIRSENNTTWYAQTSRFLSDYIPDNGPLALIRIFLELPVVLGTMDTEGLLGLTIAVVLLSAFLAIIIEALESIFSFPFRFHSERKKRLRKATAERCILPQYLPENRNEIAPRIRVGES